MFKTCSDPDFNWVHCLCDSATWVVKEPGKPIGFFYSRLFDDALSPSGLGFAVDAFRIDEDGTLDDFYSDILWDYGAADELIAAYPNKFSCAVRCDGLNPYDIPTSWSQGVVEKPVTPTDLARSASAAAATSAVIAASANQTAPKL